MNDWFTFHLLLVADAFAAIEGGLTQPRRADFSAIVAWRNCARRNLRTAGAQLATAPRKKGGAS